jgi:heme exporter protein A
MLTCENIAIYGYNKNIIDNFSVSLFPSSITYLNGGNGSGKTSILRAIACILPPSKGKISLNGVDINDLKKPYSIYIGHNIAVKKSLTVIEMLKQYSNIFNSTESIEACIYYLRLFNILNEKCENLSYGNLKKIAISRLMLLQSDLWLLDEIESNLDEANLKLLNQLILSKANNGGIIIISSHQKPNFKTAQIINISDLL